MQEAGGSPHFHCLGLTFVYVCREAAVRGMPRAVKGAAAGVSGREQDELEEEGGDARKKKQSRKASVIGLTYGNTYVWELQG